MALACRFFVVAVFLLAADPASAALDLRADNITFASAGGQQYAIAHWTGRRSSDQAEVTLTLDIEHWRAGVLQSRPLTTTIVFSEGLGDGVNCPSGCQTACAGNNCKNRNDGVITSGSCSLNALCTNLTSFTCICDTTTTKSAQITPETGDVFKLVLTPPSGVTDFDTSNNTVSVTY